ncbi:MAG: hypothetical protein DRI90_19785 [Deltaproteobacteria bacterium]|nr:MAG: hypothetical protein DRI90_19785 [Deltaproteobacteria bacterium]
MGLFAGLCLVGANAFAQPEDAEDEASTTEEDSVEGDDAAQDGDDDEDGDAKDDDAKEGDDDESEEGDDEASETSMEAKELESESYYFIGLRFRNFIVPEFMLDIFADGGATVNAFTFGPEFTYRKNGLEMVPAISYGDYSMDPFLFKGKDENDFAYERVSSDMKLLYVTLDILFEVWVEEQSRFAFLIGGGVGLAGVFGNLYRNQIYPDDPNNPDFEDQSKWENCTGATDPAGGAYCDNDNEHFGDYDEPSWANGGSKPFIFPYIAIPQLSFRFKPIKQFQARFDTGFAISTGFFLGLSAAYGL